MGQCSHVFASVKFTHVGEASFVSAREGTSEEQVGSQYVGIILKIYHMSKDLDTRN